MPPFSYLGQCILTCLWKFLLNTRRKSNAFTSCVHREDIFTLVEKWIFLQTICLQNKSILLCSLWKFKGNLQKLLKIRSSRMEVFCEKIFLKNLAIFSGKHLFWSLLLINLFIKKSLWHWCFAVNIANILRTPILKNLLEGLFLETIDKMAPCALRLVETFWLAGTFL